MERQVVLTIRNKNYNRKKVNNEIRVISKMLSNVESFKTFCNSSEAFDGDSHTIITNRTKLHDLYAYGADDKAFVYIVYKN
jgi:ABC-type uncharacterized transport system substrate-binding protein